MSDYISDFLDLTNPEFSEDYEEISEEAAEFEVYEGILVE